MTSSSLSRRNAGERVMDSIKTFIHKTLKLEVNNDKSKVGPTRLKFLSCLMSKVNGTYRFRPTTEAKEI